MKRVKKKPRKRTPDDIEAEVLAKSLRRCTLCFHLKGNLKKKRGQLAHLNGDRSNYAIDNLAFMCLKHHTLFDSTTSLHKNYTLKEVKGARAKLYAAIAQGQHLTYKKNIPAQPRGGLGQWELASAFPATSGAVAGGPGGFILKLDATLGKYPLGTCERQVRDWKFKIAQKLIENLTHLAASPGASQSLLLERSVEINRYFRSFHSHRRLSHHLILPLKWTFKRLLTSFVAR